MKQNNKRNRIAVIGVVVLVLAVVTSALAGMTYAKYVSSTTGKDIANVAKWQWSIAGTDPTVTDEFTFNLFNTIKDTNPDNTETDVSQGVEPAVTRVAPGTSGSFVIEINNASEVTGTYSIVFSEAVSARPEGVADTALPNIKFKTDLTEGEVYRDISEVTVAGSTVVAGGTASVTVYWKWDFESGADDAAKEAQNLEDTKWGILAPTITVTAAATFTQVD